MTNIATVFETQKSLESALMRRMEEFESQLKSSSSSSSEKAQVPQLHNEFKSFKQLVWNILSLLRQQIGEVLISLDQQEARHRSKFLLLRGVPEKPDDELCSTTVSLLQKHLGVKELQSSSIRSFYRLGSLTKGRVRPVIVRFTDHTLRSAVWKCKTKLKGSSLVLREFLTKTRQTLFYEARRHFGMSNVWTADGNILIKTPNGDRLKITCNNELSAAIKKFPGTAMADEAEAGASSVGSARFDSKPAQIRSIRIVKIVK
ncbi:unnamed protein product [Diatraea saccharalis]|uniref:Uncharacterized protein n=1 Tax=Diatraea saccharalis TaxID=40085 RepID=A0A9N9R602_9NEOP|nr:unnamed protein product [Diatraea saccharalis]